MNAVFSIFKNKNKDNNNTTNTNNNGPSYAGRAVSIRSNQRISDETIKKAKAAGITDKQIEDIIRQSDREDFERDLENYKSNSRTIKNKAQKSAYAKEEKARLTEKYGTYGGNFDKALTDYKNSPTSKNNDMEKWSSSEYKLSKDEKKDAKEYYNDFLDTRTSVKKKNGDNYTMKEISKMSGSNQGAKIFEKLTQEEKNEYAKMTAMKNKTSGVSSFASGVMSAFPLVSKEYDKLTGYLANDIYGLDGDYSYSEAQKNAKKQNGAANFAGNAVGTAAKYMAAGEIIPSLPGVGGVVEKTGKALSKLPVVGKLGEKALTGYAADMAADLALDTLPEYLTNKSEGMSDEEALKQAGKNVAINAGMNAAFGLLPAGIKNIKAENKKAAEEAAEEVTKNVNEFFNRKTAEEAIEETAEKEVADVVKEDINSVVPQATKGNVDDVVKNNLPDDVKQIDTPERLGIPQNEDIPSDPIQLTGTQGVIELPTKQDLENLYNSTERVNKGTGLKRNDGHYIFGSGMKGKSRGLLTEIDNIVYQALGQKGKSETADIRKRLKAAIRTFAETGDRASYNELMSATDDLAKLLPEKYDYNPGATSTELKAQIQLILDEPDIATNLIVEDMKDTVYNPDIPYDEKVEAVMNVINSKHGKIIQEKYLDDIKDAMDFVRSEEGIKAKYSQNIDETPVVEDVVNAIKTGDDVILNPQKIGSNTNNSNSANFDGFNEVSPSALKGNRKISKSRTNTMPGTEMADEATLNFRSPKELFAYDSISEKQSVNEALDMINRDGVKETTDRLLGKDNLTGVDIDALMSLWESIVTKANDLDAQGLDSTSLWNKSNTIFKKIQEQSTENGQAIQALAKWSRKTPTGMLAYAERIINGKATANTTDKIQKEIEKYVKNRNGDKEISAEFTKEFLSLATEYGKLDANSREAKELLARMGKLVSGEIPASMPEKVKTILMDNMLGNFRTLITRNAGGNLGFAGLEQIKKVPAAAIDKALSKATGKRTTATLSRESLSKYMEGFAKGIKEEKMDFASDLHTLRSGETDLKEAIASNRHVFDKNNANTVVGKALNSTLDKYDKLVKHGLSIGDRPFYEATYAQTLEEYKQLGKDKILGKNASKISDDDFKKISEIAARTNALAAVYQDDTLLSKALLEMKQGVADLSKGLTGVDILSQFSMPFIKTPANIVTRTIEYSPFGIVKNGVNTIKDLGGIKNIKDNGISQALSDLSVDAQSRIANETARNILGLGLTGLGVAAKDSGLLTGSLSDDTDEKKAQVNAGMQEYALNTGKGNFDISWIPVLGTNLVAGAAMKDAASDPNNTVLENLASGLGEGFTSLTEQSLFQGMQRLFGADTYNKGNSMVDNLANTVKSGASQLVPSLVRQVANTTDEYERDTTGGDYDYSLLSAIPGLRQKKLQPKVDVYGEEVRTNQGRNLGSRVLENMISPGKYTELKTDDLTKELFDINEQSQENPTKQFMPYYKRDKIATLSGYENASDLSDKEYNNAKKEISGNSVSIVKKLMNTDVYKNANADKKADMIAMAQTVSQNTYRLNHDKGYEPTQNKKLINAFNEGGVDGYVKYVTDNEKADANNMNYDTYIKKMEEGGEEAVKKYAENKQIAQSVGESKGTTLTESTVENLMAEGGIDAVNKYADSKVKVDAINKKSDIGMTVKTYDKIYEEQGQKGIDEYVKNKTELDSFNKKYNTNMGIDEYQKYKNKGATNSDIVFLNSMKEGTKQIKEKEGVSGNIATLKYLADQNISNAERSKYILLNSKPEDWGKTEKGKDTYKSRGIATFGTSAAYQILANKTLASSYDGNPDGMTQKEVRAFVNDTYGANTELAAKWYKVLTGKDY